MITIYEATETDFKHNGLGVLNNCLRCEVEEILNDLYAVDLEYPTNDPKSKLFVENRIIKVPTPNGYQLFRIYRPEKDLTVTRVQGKHIFFDLQNNFIESTRTGKLNGQQALDLISSKFQFTTPFKFYSNIEDVADAFYVRRNGADVFVGNENNAFVKRWHGEILRDNFEVHINNSIGENRGVRIEYKKNLIGFEEDVDTSDIMTRIMPTGLNKNNAVVFIDEKYIDSKHIDDYPTPIIRHVHYGDIQESDEEGNIVTLNEVKERLKQEVTKLYDVKHVDLPRRNYKVSFVELSKTQEYKNYEQLEQVRLGDIVTVNHRKLGVQIEQKVVKYRYDSLLNKFIEIELGEILPNIMSDMSNVVSDISETKEEVQKASEETGKQFLITDGKINVAMEEIGKTQVKIEVTEDRIITQVEDVERNLGSRITQNAEEIELRVEKDGIISAINQSAEQITISADKIDMQGTVTFHDLAQNGLGFEGGETKIQGGKLTGSEIVSGIVDAQSFHSRGESYFYNNVIVQAKAEIHGYLGMQQGQCSGVFNMNSGYCYNHFHAGDLDVTGNLTVNGEKNRAVKTDHYGTVKLNAVESCECYFEDVGRGKLENGKYIIRMDKKFLETVNTNIQYEVQTWAYGNGNVWVNPDKMYPQYVVVEGTNDINFGYKIIAKQRGYENNRLEERKRLNG